MKLLIVDDHAGVRAMIRELAGEAPTQVRECACGEAAIAVAREFAPDVITLDARMPGLGGLETARVLRVSYPHTPILVVSAYDLPALRTAALHAGASDFVAKDDLGQLRPILARIRSSLGGPETFPCQPNSHNAEA